MRQAVRRRHEAHGRVQGVCAEHSALFDAAPGGQKARAALGADVAEVDSLLALQERSVEERRAATEQSRVSRRALRAAARAVVSVGRMVNLDTDVMGTMKVPGSTSGDELLAYSRALLERVSSYADAFVAEGLPPDLLKHLDEGIGRFAAARDRQAATRQRFSGAFEAIRETLDHADKAVDVLQAIVMNTPDAPPEVLTKLRMARRVGPRVAPAQQPPKTATNGKAA